MATNVLTTGNTAETSSEIASTVGTPITFYLKGEDATGNFRFNREEQTYEIGVFRGD